MSSLETPRFLKMMAATTPTVTLGRPIARYSEGTQVRGERKDEGVDTLAGRVGSGWKSAVREIAQAGAAGAGAVQGDLQAEESAEDVVVHARGLHLPGVLHPRAV